MVPLATIALSFSADDRGPYESYIFIYGVAGVCINYSTALMFRYCTEDPRIGMEAHDTAMKPGEGESLDEVDSGSGSGELVELDAVIAEGDT